MRTFNRRMDTFYTSQCRQIQDSLHKSLTCLTALQNSKRQKTLEDMEPEELKEWRRQESDWEQEILDGANDLYVALTGREVVVSYPHNAPAPVDSRTSSAPILGFVGDQPYQDYHPTRHEEYTYARVGGPPEEWRSLQVIDEVTGQIVSGVVEVDCKEGWLRRYVSLEQLSFYFSTQRIEVEHIVGKFRIERMKVKGKGR